ncbi:hypothetical protein WJX72_008148 [[Myrmecia] bisecta]|uniref:Uncharacterized protein n=1 Tax=[Myrmecia] bisecta TaxID=41462 RepID=A0AAW1PQD3_9CHLO
MAATADQEVASLDRVLTRLAMTEESSLEKVLTKLLPLVIDQLKSPHEATRKKVLEMLMHVNKRVRDHHEVKLPLEALVALYMAPASAALVRNFALVYVEMAFERSTPEQRNSVVAQLMTGISGKSQQHREMLLRMAITGCEFLATLPSHKWGTEEEFRAKYPFLQSPGDAATFLDFAFKTLLYQPPQLGYQRALTPLQLAQQAQQGQQGAQQAPAGQAGNGVAQGNGAAGAAHGDAPAAAPTGPPPAPAGLSRAELPAITGKNPPTGDVLVNRKLGILNFTAAAGLPPADVVLHYLVAATDSADAVSRRGDELLRKRCGLDSPKPAVDLEDKALVDKLFALFHGRTDEGLDDDAKVVPAGPLLQARLVSLFTKSITAANCFPATVQAIFACVYGPQSTLRLKQSGMEFAVWVFKHASDEQLKPMAPATLQGLLRILDDESLKTVDNPTLTLRGFTYQAVGQLAQRVPTLFQNDTDIAARFFAALSWEPPGVRASVQEAVSTLATSYTGCTGEAAAKIEGLLLDSIASPQEASRLCAVQWAVRLFPFDHLPARYICILGAGDHKLEIREGALKGLKPPKDPKGKAPQKVSYPAPGAAVAYFTARHPRLGQPTDMGKPLLLQPKAFLALIAFLRRCRSHQLANAGGAALADGDTEMTSASSTLPDAYTGVLEHALIKDSTSELYVAALEALLEVAADAPHEFAQKYSARLQWLRAFLAHIDAAARDLAAKLCSIVALALDPAAADGLLADLTAAFGHADEKVVKFEEQDGCIAAAGYVLAQCSTGTPAALATAQAAAATALCQALTRPTTALAATAAAALGHVGLRGPLPLPLGEAPASSAGPPPPASSAVPSPSAETSAATSATDGGANPAAAEAATQREALCFAFGGVTVTPDTILRTSYTSLSSHLTAIESADSEAAPAEPMAVDNPAAGKQPAKVDSPARSEAQDRIIHKVLDEFVFHSRPEVRCAGCIWLLSLVSFTGQHPRLLPLLPEIQEAFSHLLGDPNELTQEMASRGMSVVYSLGDEAARKELLNTLMGTLQGGPKKRRAVKLTGESKVFEEGQIGEAPGGGSISTYKELCALATDLGQPDLIYRFMDLANHHASLNSSRGAAFGFASIAKLAGEQLEPYVAKLVPKLYRYQYDPNGRVRDSMAHIWRALVAEPKKTVDEHFDAIVAELLKEMGGRLWRNREASCLALSDLLQGRRWPEIKGVFEPMWSMTLRALDDIKESVRLAATTLVRSLRGLTLHLADPAATSAADSAEAVAAALPLLLEKGMSSSVGEVQGLALTTIAKMVKAAGPAHIQPHLVDLTAAMLESLSGMEDSRLNYIEQHAGRLGLDSERLENMRVSASKSSPMSDTLDLCARYVSAATLEALVPRLVVLVKRGTGLNTRVGTARFIAALTMRLASDIRPQSAVLIKALLGAARAERSSAVKRAYASSAASVAKYATDARVGKMVSEAVELYSDPGDMESRYLAGLIIKELSRQAADVFNAHKSQAMPLAFVAASDEDADVAALWKEVWEDSTSSQAAALRLYMADLVPLVTAGLASQQWGRKRSSAKAIVALAEAGADAVQPHAAGLATALLQELPGRLWEGKEAVLEALAALCKAAPAQIDAAGGPGSTTIVAAVVAASARRKTAFRVAALCALEAILRAAPGTDHFGAVCGPLFEACRQHSSDAAPSKAPADKEKDTGEGGEEEAKPLPLLESIKCLAAAWLAAGPVSINSYGAQMAQSLALCLKASHPWPIRVAALEAGRSFIGGRESGAAATDGAAQRVLEGAQLEWAGALIPGILECTGDVKISQVRSAALDTLGALLKTSNGGALLQAGDVASIQARLDAMLASEKNTVLKAQASTVSELLQRQPAPMSLG